MADPSNAAAVAGDPSLPDLREDDRDFAVAGRAQDAIQADLLVDALEEAGIDAFVDSDRDGMVEKLSSPAEGYPIKVPRKDLERGSALLAERKAALEADPEAGARAAEEAQEAEAAAEKALQT